MTFGGFLTEDSIDFGEYLKDPDDTERVRPASEYHDDLLDELYNASYRQYPDTGFDSIKGKLMFRPGEVTMWAGYNGHRKSMLLSQVCLWMIEHGEKAMIASLELAPRKTLKRMVIQALAGDPSREQAIKFIKWLNGRLWIYDQQARVKPDRMLAVLKYSADKLGCTHLVLDPLTKCGVGYEDYEAQTSFADSLTSIARDYNVHIHVVAHMRKPGGRDNSEDMVPDRYAIRGAGALTDLAHNVLIVWKNKLKLKKLAELRPDDDEREDWLKKPDQVLVCDKQREGEWEGACKLWFRGSSLLMRDSHESFDEPVRLG